MGLRVSRMHLFSLVLFWMAAGRLFFGADDPDRLISIIPKPSALQLLEGGFALDPQTRIYVENRDPEVRQVGEYLSSLLSHAMGRKAPLLPLSTAVAPRDTITLSLRESDSSGLEGYVLVINPKAVRISAANARGLFYGVQTLRQILPPEIEAQSPLPKPILLPCLRIQDQPRFSWRGLMLDCSRTFLPIEYLRRNIDRMALYKLNILHLHLTDDQGWRLEIEKHPELTAVGAHYSERYGGAGGYYTQKEIRELVSYARERNITIVPEIEMPGHSVEVLAAYPELACDLPGKKNFEVHPFWVDPEFSAPLCAGDEKVFDLIRDVLTEVIDLFPSEFIHVGGDEVSRESWKSCPKCQARMQAEGLQDPAELQSYFMRRVEKMIAAKGRRMIGWDEILEGGLAPGASVMSWRGIEGGVSAAASGHDTVMVPNENCYFDFAYSRTPTERVYACDPVPEALAGPLARRILGVQGAMWTHMSDNLNVFDYQMVPRMVALSEVAWSPRQSREWSDFDARLNRHYRRFELLGIQFFNKGSVYTKIGSWEASALSPDESRPFEWDVTTFLTEAGDYQVQVRRDPGRHGVFVSTLSLLEGENEIARDEYAAQINTYIDTKVSWLTLHKPRPGISYRIRLTLQGTKTGSEAGSVWILGPTGNRSASSH